MLKNKLLTKSSSMPNLSGCSLINLNLTRKKKVVRKKTKKRPTLNTIADSISIFDLKGSGLKRI
jgi:hypothetical protein